MSKKANPTAVGIFVVGAVILAVISILMFGSGRFFAKTENFILYFADSVNGLDVGSSVKFKGVRIGQVRQVLIRFNQPEDVDYIPVIVEIDTTRLKNDLGVREINLEDDVEFDLQVREGLRGRLQFESYVTGKLFVDLDYYPTAPKPAFVQTVRAYKEIPTLPSNTSEVLKSATTTLANISKVDFAGIARRLDGALDKLDRGLSEIEFRRINEAVVATVENARRISGDPKIPQLLENLDATLAEYRKLGGGLNQRVEPLFDNLNVTVVDAKGAIRELHAATRALAEMLEPESAFRYEVDVTLREFSGAARAVRLLADYLERNPNALLTGKENAK